LLCCRLAGRSPSTRLPPCCGTNGGGSVNCLSTFGRSAILWTRKPARSGLEMLILPRSKGIVFDPKSAICQPQRDTALRTPAVHLPQRCEDAQSGSALLASRTLRTSRHCLEPAFPVICQPQFLMSGAARCLPDRFESSKSEFCKFDSLLAWRL
jgi:hypothetical protein